MQIRPSQTTDWQTLKTVRLAALQDSPRAYGQSYAEAATLSDKDWQDLATPGQNPEFTFAFDGENVVGLIGYVIPSAEFNVIAMWVAPTHRQRAIGTKLLAALKKRAQTLGHSTMALMVSPENHAAVQLYRQSGFAFINHHEALTSFPEVQIQKMTLTLN